MISMLSQPRILHKELQLFMQQLLPQQPLPGHSIRPLHHSSVLQLLLQLLQLRLLLLYKLEPVGLFVKLSLKITCVTRQYRIFQLVQHMHKSLEESVLRSLQQELSHLEQLLHLILSHGIQIFSWLLSITAQQLLLLQLPLVLHGAQCTITRSSRMALWFLSQLKWV